MSSCFSRCVRVPIAIRAFYESYLWILQTLLLTHPDLHPGLIGIKTQASRTTGKSALTRPGHLQEMYCGRTGRFPLLLGTNDQVQHDAPDCASGRMPEHPANTLVADS